MDRLAVILVLIGLVSLIVSAAFTPWTSIVLVLDFAAMMAYSTVLSKKKSAPEGADDEN